MKPKYFFILTVLALWVGACAPATPPAVAPTQAATEPASNGYSVNIYRVENIPGNVFEEVTVQAINQTLEGPRGLIKGVR